MKYNGIGFNAEFLSQLNEKEFINEVKHHFQHEGGKEQMKELYSLIKSVNPVKGSTKARNHKGEEGE